jgi:VWFA-related protein
MTFRSQRRTNPENRTFQTYSNKRRTDEGTRFGSGIHDQCVDSGTQRLTIFVLDFVNSSLNEQRTARRDLLKFLSKSLDIKEPVSLLAVQQSGIKAIHDFTTDPAVLMAALERVTDHASSKERPESNPLDDAYRSVIGWNSRSDTQNVAMAQNRLNSLMALNNAQAAGRTERVAVTLEALREIGEAFSGIPGRKSMVWATAGFPFEIDDGPPWACAMGDFCPHTNGRGAL